MKKFDREDPESPYYYENRSSDLGTWGTPFRSGGQDFRSFMDDFDNFEPDADAYIYVVVLERHLDSSTWYYVGEVTGNLKSRLADHARGFTNSRPIRQHGEEVLNGDDSASNCVKTETYRTIGIDRVESIHFDEVSFDENVDGKWGTSHAWKQHRDCYIEERERRMAYEVALDHSTTNVLGGK